MSKVYDIVQEGDNTIEGWHGDPRFPYGSTARQSILDPDGATARYQITSIPSPFARIDLVKNAFIEVTKLKDLDGDTIFHKMVSDSLDVGEIFFNIDKLRDKVEIIKWDSEKQLAELEKSTAAGHKYLADTLRKYMKADAKAYNFNGGFRGIYILNYLKGPGELNIIGATSPATLFFSNANNLNYVTDIQFGTDKPFDAKYQPLYKRDAKYIEYLFALRKSIDGFSQLFPAVEGYLELTLEKLEQSLRERINRFEESEITTFETIPISEQQTSNQVEVLGFELRRCTNKFKDIVSDFRIDPTAASNEGELPLALPVEAGDKYSELRYTTAQWGSDSAAPYHYAADIDKRTLPHDGSKAPYLTISDFLEDTVVHVPHRLNRQCYHDGGIESESGDSAYLIPLKPLFFKYFSVKDLLSNERLGKPMLEMEEMSGSNGVMVKLRIPIRGNKKVRSVEYVRIYYKENTADVEENRGGFKTFPFMGFVSPLVAFNDPKDANYVVTCIPEKAGTITFSLYKGADALPLETSKYCRNEGRDILAGENYQLVGDNFDYIQVSNYEGIKGILIPKFESPRTSEEYEFTVDLGTSNTHVEFKKRGDKVSSALSISPTENIVCEMFIDRGGENMEVLNADYIPIKLGNGEDLHLPTRTVLSFSEKTQENDRLTPLTHANLPFTYDKRSGRSYNKYVDNIKWASDDKYRNMQAYIECLMHLMRNKVLTNGGDLKRTKVTWFYPNSMPRGRRDAMAEEWNNAFNTYFGLKNTNSMNESVAPILYRFSALSNSRSMVQIDIGGGTTDVAFAREKRITHTTSFRFAANSLFENVLAEGNQNNGIIDFHKEKIKATVSKIKTLADIFESKSNESPANMASFLFALKDNKLVKDFKDEQNTRIAESAVDFNAILRKDEDFKIVFVLFYTAIIYHVAKIIKVLDLELPRHISFSGNGSKLVTILSSNTETLTDYTKLILERVTGKTYGSTQKVTLVGLERNENPKEITCKGGFIELESDGNTASENIVLKCSGDGLVEAEKSYKDITEKYIQDALKEVQEFFRFSFEELNRAFKFSDNFNASKASVTTASEIAQQDLDTFLKKGIDKCRREAGENEGIGETLFFYPIAGALNAITQAIYEQLTTK